MNVSQRRFLKLVQRLRPDVAVRTLKSGLPFVPSCLPSYANSVLDYPPTQTGYQYQKRDGAGPGPCSLLRRTADGEMVHPAGYTLTLTPEHSVIVQCRAFYQWEETRSQLTINEGDEFDTEFWSFNLGHELLHSLIDNSKCSILNSFRHC